LLQAQSEYIANLQRMLQSACQEPPPLSSGSTLGSGSAVVGSQCSQFSGVPGPEQKHSASNFQSTAWSPGTSSRSGVTAAVPLSPPSSSTVTQLQGTRRRRASDPRTEVEVQLPSPRLMQQLPQQPLAMPADAGAGSPQQSRHNAATSSEDSAIGTVDTAARVEEVANEVLRLRLLRSQHEELKAQLARAEGTLKRLSPHAVFQFRSYLERHLKEPSLTAQLQEAIMRLVQCLCAVNRVEINMHTSESCLNSVRKLLRDAHTFPHKLASIAPDFSSEEAKGLAPFLLSSTEFQRVKDKEVNECYEVFHAWLSAFYLFSVVADQVAPVTQELTKQEWLLRRLNGQVDEVHRSSGAASSPRTSMSATPSAVAAAASSSSRGARGSNSQRGGATASPLGKSRATLQGTSQQRPRVSAASTKARPVGATLGEVPEIGQSRSPSPTQRARAGDSTLKQRGRVATGGAARTSPPPQRSTCTATAYGTIPAKRDGQAASSEMLTSTSSGSRPLGSGESTITSVSGTASQLHTGDRAVQRASRDTRGRRESRSPSQGPGRLSPTPAPPPPQGPAPRSPSPIGAGRGSPNAPQPRSVRTIDRPPLGARDAPSAGPERRALSPSRSDYLLPVVQRMNSAPTTGMEPGSRSIAVRTVKGGQPVSSRSGAGGSIVAAPAGPLLCGSSTTPAGSVSSTRGAVRSSAASLRPTSTVVLPAAAVSASRGGSAVPVAPPLSPDKGAGGAKGEACCNRSEETSAESTPTSADSSCSPRRRRLSKQQYEALLKCARQIAAGPTAQARSAWTQ